MFLMAAPYAYGFALSRSRFARACIALWFRPTGLTFAPLMRSRSSQAAKTNTQRLFEGYTLPVTLLPV